MALVRASQNSSLNFTEKTYKKPCWTGNTTTLFLTGAHVIIFDLVHWRRQGLDQIISTINIKMSVLVKPHCTARQTRPCSNWNRRSRKKNWQNPVVKEDMQLCMSPNANWIILGELKRKKIICGPCNALHKGAKSFQREYFPFFDTETKFQMAGKFKWPIWFVNVHLVYLIE